jgi:Fe-Mn family superoxide dismutase
MFELIQLPYGIDALELVISSKTLEFHHGKHLKGYVDNLNKLIVGTEFDNMPIEEIVIKAPAGPIFNNAGQVLNHNLYFTQFKVIGKDGKGGMSLPAPTGNLLAQINRQWGTLDAFKAEFEQKGASLFGSGWVWLQADANGELSIAQYAGADNPFAHGLKPILTFDVWEHAYYLDYQNRRAAYLAELWRIVDWEVVEARYNGI